MDSLQDFSHSPSVKVCNTTIPYHVYLYGYVIWACVCICRVFVQLGIKLSTDVGEAHCYNKTNGDRFCNVTWSNCPVLGIGGLISDVRQSHQKERIGQKWF